jgi:hypothetical protein
MSYARRGMGAIAQANPYAGTYSDLNCPTSCWALGNGLDSILGSMCWPCHNACPPGTIWDTANNACSGSPSAPNPIVPVTDTGAPPVDCSTWWNQYTNVQCGGSTYTLPLVLGGALLAGIVLLGVLKK